MVRFIIELLLQVHFGLPLNWPLPWLRPWHFPLHWTSLIFFLLFLVALIFSYCLYSKCYLMMISYSDKLVFWYAQYFSIPHLLWWCSNIRLGFLYNYTQFCSIRMCLLSFDNFISIKIALWIVFEIVPSHLWGFLTWVINIIEDISRPGYTPCINTQYPILVL